MSITSGSTPIGSFLKTHILTGNVSTGFSSAIVGNAKRHDFPFLNNSIFPSVQLQSFTVAS